MSSCYISYCLSSCFSLRNNSYPMLLNSSHFFGDDYDQDTFRLLYGQKCLSTNSSFISVHYKITIQRYAAGPSHLRLLSQAVKSHEPGLNAHHNGCKGIALTPRWTILKRKSCKRGSAASPSSGGDVPVQNTSAELAARGQMIPSIFCGDDCSVHRSC